MPSKAQKDQEGSVSYSRLVKQLSQPQAFQAGYQDKESKDFAPTNLSNYYWVFPYLSHLPGQADNNVGVTSCLVSACVAAEGAAAAPR